MNVPFIDGLTLLHPVQGLVALGLLAVLAIFLIVMNKKKPVRRERHTYIPMEVHELNSARSKESLVMVVAVLISFALAFGTTQPAMAMATAKENTLVCYVVDASTSMLTPDVVPTREGAMRSALTEAIDSAPANTQQCVVSFAGEEHVDIVIEPSLNKQEALSRIESIDLQAGTAVGEGVFAAIEVVEAMEDTPLRSAEEIADGEEPPVAFVLLSDGLSLEGRSPEEAAAKAAELGIPVHAIAYGDPETNVVSIDGTSQVAKPDRQSMQAVAEISGGTFYEAISKGDLDRIFSDVSTRVATETEHQIIISSIAAWIILLLVVAFIVTKTGWFRRIY